MRSTKPSPSLLFAVLAAALAFALAAPPVLASDAAAGGSAARKKEKKEKAAGAKKEGEKKDEDKPFADVVKDFAVQEGLFTIYRKDDKNFLEIKPDQYDKFYLISLTRVSGVGQSDLLGNMMLWNYPVQLHKVGKSVHMIIKNVMFRADSDEAMRRAVDRSFSDSVAGVAKFESLPHPDRKSDLVDLSAFFIRDIERVEQYTDEELKSGYKMDKDASYLGAVKTFPRNVEIEAVMHFANPRSKVFGLLPDSRSMLIRYNYSLSALPEGNYRPRLADDRVGHFVTTVADYSSDRRHLPAVRYVERWDLQKADPSAAVSAPKEPITFYLDPSIPKRYRKAVADGILVWNKAFERIGFKDAVVVKEAPDDPDWDSADARYSSVRWFVAADSIFAIGPSRSNPFTGQLYDADIGFTESMTRFGRHEYRELVDPLSMIQRMAAEAWSSRGRDAATLGPAGSGASLFRNPALSCGIGAEAHRQAAFGWGLLEARGVLRPGSAEEDAYVDEFLVGVTAHEVGHTLGLRHNFRASLLHPVEELQNTAKTTEMGLTGSVMEYTPVNLAPKGRKQGQYYQTTLGPYDYWAIEYAYKPLAVASSEAELPDLAKIASRSAEPALAYATDEDVVGWVFAPVGMDPRNHQWDIGADPLTYYTERVKLARELWDALPGKVVENGEGYQIVRRSFNQGVGEYVPAIFSATKHVGGVMHNRDHVGDPGGRQPYVPMPAAEQRRALAFLNTYLFAPDAFQFRPDLINALAVERFGEFVGFALLPRLDYPVHDLVLTLQDLALARLYHPVLLTRVVDADTKVARGQDRVSMAEIFSTLREGIWSELPAAPASASAAPGPKPSKVEVDSFRRALQRRQLGYLITLATATVDGAPQEAATLARADLIDLKGRIGSALKAPAIDPATKAHLNESLSRIDQALDARYLRTM